MNIILVFILMNSCIKNHTLNNFAIITQSNGEQKIKEIAPVNNSSSDIEIKLDPSIRYQQMDGFGYTLTGGSAMHIFNMDSKSQDSLLQSLFDSENGSLKISYLRLSLGASDLDSHPWSYNDLSSDQKDLKMLNFSLNKDTLHLLPILKKIKHLNPHIKLMASPWSAPTWMKSNKDSRGGELLKKYYSSYAWYFLKYLKAMEKEGIKIDAITIQNEPHHPANNPSMYMSAEDQTNFIANHLGPLFDAHQIDTKIIIWDHNADEYDYPLKVLNDSKANSYIDGTAFHLYAGSISSLSIVHDAFPSKNIYFTEQWTGGPGNFKEDFRWHFEQLMIGAPNNWSKIVLEWNLTNDAQYEPHTDRGGCTTCLGAITIDNHKITKNPSYYVMAHTAPFVKPGAYRIHSTQLKNLPNTAYENKDGSISLLVYNSALKSQTIRVVGLTEVFSYHIPAQSALSVNFY